MSIRFKFGKTSGGEPMPTLPIRLLDDDGSVVTNSEMAIVDTGSDGTMIPVAILKLLGFIRTVNAETYLQYSFPYRKRRFWGIH